VIEAVNRHVTDSATRRPPGSVEDVSELPPSAPSEGSEPISDDDRDRAVRQIQQALAADLIEFEELDGRFTSVYAAITAAELAATTNDLPQLAQPTPPPRHPMPTSAFSVFGDVERGGDLDIDEKVYFFSGFGDIVVDLSSAVIADDATITLLAVFGDVTVILADGVRVRRSSLTIFGDQHDDLAPPAEQAPTIRIAAHTLFGDTRVYSLSRVPRGGLRRLWRSWRS